MFGIVPLLLKSTLFILPSLIHKAARRTTHSLWGQAFVLIIIKQVIKNDAWMSETSVDIFGDAVFRYFVSNFESNSIAFVFFQVSKCMEDNI
jgi:hypothetical protein